MNRLLCKLFIVLICCYTNSFKAQEISYIFKGNVIHNSKAIFPIGYWMEYNPILDKEKAADTLIKYGFDMFTYGVGIADKPRFEAIFNKATTANMRIIYGLYGSGNILGSGPSPAEDWVLTSNGTNIRNNSSLIGYYHSDDVFRFAPADLVAKNNVVKGIDNTRLTTISSFFAGETAADYMPAADMIAAQVYPVTQTFFHGAYTSSRKLVLAAQAAGKAPSIYPQTHNIGLWTNDNTQRMPTPREFDVTTYLDVIAGAKSLWFYTYGATDKTPNTGLINYQNDVWLKSLQVKNELRAWDRVLMFGKHFTESDISAGSANFTTFQGHWIYGNKVYVIAANSWQNDIRGDRTKFVSITLPEGTTGPVTPVFNNRNQTLSMTNNVLSGNIDYYDVQFYELPYTKPTVINGDFQTDLNDWTNNGSTIITEGTQKYIKASPTNEINSITKDVLHRILPNKSYSLSADTKSVGAGTGGVVFIQFRDYKNNNIATYNIPVSSSTTFTPGIINFTAPEEFGYVTVGVWRNTPGTGDFFVDNINIVENTSLALENITLQANKEGTATTLQWNTNAASNSFKTFNIQRSFNGVNFENISTISNSNNARYRNVDYTNINGKVYYRIAAATDKSTIVYSNTVIIENNTNNKVLLYPNPTNDVLNVMLTNNENATFSLFDEKGVLVKKQQLQNTSNTVNTTQVSSGNYIYEIRSKENKVIKTGTLLIKH